MLLAFDSETWMIEPGRAVPRAVCWSFATQDGRNWLMLADEGCRYLAERIDAGDTLIAHNAPFDLSVAAEHYPPLLRKIFEALERGQIRDSKIRQGLIDIEVGRRKNPASGRREVMRNGEWSRADYSLAGSKHLEGSTGLVGYYLGKNRSADKGEDSWRTRYATLDGLPLEKWPEDAKRYAAEDAVDTLNVYLAQQTRYGDKDNLETPLVDEVRQNRKAFVLALVSAWGLRTDKATLDELEQRCLKVRDEIRIKMMSPGVPGCAACAAGGVCKEHGLYRFEGPKKDPRRKIVKNTKAIKARLEAAFKELQLDPPLTDKGAIKTDKDALIMSGDPLLEELADAGPASTVLTTFLPALRMGTEHPINTVFDPLLDTGRISSSRPNLNNIPRGDILEKLLGTDVRSAVIAPEGYYLCSCDYSNAELRSHAQVNYWLFGESAMGDLFKADPDADPYLALAASIMEISLDEAKRRRAAKDPEVKDMRQLCKALVLALPGGLGPHKFVETARKQYGVKITVSEARRRREDWKRTYPEMRKYLDYISQRTQNGYFTLEQFVSGRKRGMCGFTDGANSFFQGLTADGAAHALWLVAREAYLEHLGSPLYGSRIVGFLYDEILALVPIDVAHEAAHRLSEIMVSAMSEFVPDVPNVAYPALMKRWRKEAEPKYADGRLVPWDA